jgi:cysteine desulfurase
MTVYLDHNASSPLRPEAKLAMLSALEKAGNPSSLHSEGRAARDLVESSRERIATVFGVPARSIVFTSGGTEAASWLLRPALATGHRFETLVLSPTEHACVLEGHGFAAESVVRLAVDAGGRVRMSETGEGVQLMAEASESGAPISLGRSSLLAVQAANNETGVIQPLEALSRSGAVWACDITQAIGRLPLDAARTGADMLFFSAHKFGGPKGVGAAIILNDAVQPEPLMRGGGQEFRRRSGTENVAGIAGMAAALACAVGEADALAARAMTLRARLEDGLRDIAPDAVIFGEHSPRLPNTTCYAVPGLSAETLLMAFDLEGIAVSSGSACSSGKVSPSYVLAAMGVPRDLAKAAIRISSGWTTASGDIERFLDVWRKIYGRLRHRAAA